MAESHDRHNGRVAGEGAEAPETAKEGTGLPVPDPEVRVSPARSGKAQRRQFSAEYKRQILQEADACTSPGELGALLRREGLYSSHLTTWRTARERGLFDPARVAKLVSTLDGESVRTHQIWTLLMLELWFRAFIDAPRSGSLAPIVPSGCLPTAY